MNFFIYVLKFETLWASLSATTQQVGIADFAESAVLQDACRRSRFRGGSVLQQRALRLS